MEHSINVKGVRASATGLQFDNGIAFHEWEELGAFLYRAHSGVQWWIGDWLNYGEGRPDWGSKYESAVERFRSDRCIRRVPS